MREVNHSIIVQEFEENEVVKFLAFFPDFGQDTCFCVGESMEEAVAGLQNKKLDVFDFYHASCRQVPEPFDHTILAYDEIGDLFGFFWFRAKN